MRLRTDDARGTHAAGRELAALLEPGDVIVLTGELGAGKTTFTQGVAAGLGIEEAVVSPTFVLVREYEGRRKLVHVDVYRLDRVQDALDLGLDEFTDDAVLMVEWGDAVEDLLGPDRLRVELRLPDPDPEPDPNTEGAGDARRIDVTPVGLSWDERMNRLVTAFAPWMTQVNVGGTEP